ncbi:MAG: hypothetical protein KAU49_00625 [Candidatus Krumholzibacteria bacterium]|nr:hypothetical protein [Candidatus Krumholzibacteria bacterium]
MIPGILSAQDAHYWTLQYGTRAELLGGMVVGSIKDLSSTFYNPGAAAYSIDQGLLLTTDAFELTHLDLHAGSGHRIDISDTRLSKAPGMFAMRFPFDVFGGNQIAFSYLTRQSFELELSDKNISSWWDPGWGTGNENFSGEFRFYEYLNETWVGASWAKKLSDRMALGATLYGIYRSQRMRIQTILRGAQVDGPGASAMMIREYSYWNASMLLKAGAAFDYRPLAFGVALTLPNLSLFGDGKTYYDNSVVNIDIDGDGTPDSYLTSDFQEGLSSTYRTPASIAVGTSYGYRTTTFHFSTEYFGMVKMFDILEPASFRSQTTGDTFSEVVTGGMKGIFNLGIGLDRKFSEGFSLYCGFTTDKSGWKEEVNTNITSWDLYHLNLGGAFRALDIDWTLGLGYSWGGDDMNIDLGFIDDSGSSGIIGEDGFSARTEYTKLKVILGFAFPTREQEGTEGG